MTEQELIEACVQKDPAAQSIVYKRLYGKMLGVCIRYAGDGEVARDYLQEGFLLLFDKIGSYMGRGSFEGWARRLFVNNCLNLLRKDKALRYSQDIDSAPDIMDDTELPIDRMGAADLLALVACMPTGFRTVFNLHAVEGYPLTEVSRILGIEAVTARSQYYRARLWLKGKITEGHAG